MALVKCVSIVARSLVYALSILPLAAAADDPQLLAEFRKTRPDVSQVHVIAETPLLVAASGEKGWGKGELLGVFARRGEQIVQIAMLPNDEFPASVSIGPQSADSITLGLVDFDSHEQFDNIKIFFDPHNYFPKRIVRFAPVHIHRITLLGGVVTLHGSNDKLEFTATESNGVWKIRTGPAMQPEPPRPLESVAQVTPMPVSTFGEFEEARPERAKQMSEGAVIEEKPGPYQKAGNRIWVGKTFLESDRSAGVGDIGYFDETAQDWGFLHIPEMQAWSASAMLVETDAIWVGLARYGEGATVSGGLLRYDRTTKKAAIIPLADEIQKITRVGRRLYCGTFGGFAVIEQDHARRFEFAPQLDGTYTITPVI
jgi:hypothetical protein